MCRQKINPVSLITLAPVAQLVRKKSVTDVTLASGRMPQV